MDDTGNHCIRVFTAEGKYLKQFTGHGAAILNRPYGIAIDSNNMVYVKQSHLGVQLGGSFCDIVWAEGGGARRV